MFQFIQPTTVTLTQITTHLVKRGKKDFRDAYTLHFELDGPNWRVLSLLHADLCAALFHDPDGEAGQATIPGAQQVLPVPRFPKLKVLPWPDEQTGVDLTLVYGLGDEVSNIELEDCKQTIKNATHVKDGFMKLSFSLWTESMPDGALDKLRKKQRQEVSITVVHPERLRDDAVSSGAVGAPTDNGAPLLDAGDAFAAAHAGETMASEGGRAGPEDDEDGSEGGETDAGAGETTGAESGTNGASGETREPERGPGWPFPQDGAGAAEQPPQDATHERVPKRRGKGNGTGAPA